MDLEKQKMADVQTRGELVFLRNKVSSYKQDIATLRKLVAQRDDEKSTMQRLMNEKEARMVCSVCQWTCLFLFLRTIFPCYPLDRVLS